MKCLSQGKALHILFFTINGYIMAAYLLPGYATIVFIDISLQAVIIAPLHP